MSKKKFNPADNLIPNSERTPSERRENARKAGIASGEARRRKRGMKEIAEIALEMQVKKGRAADIEALRSMPELKGKNVKVEEAIVLAVVQNALKGDINSIKLLMELTGQQPSEKIDINATVRDEGKLGSIVKQLDALKKK